MKYSNIIFDFDGVIIESNHVKDKAFFDIFINYGHNVAKFSYDYHLANRGVSRFDKISYVMNRFNLPDYDKKKIINDFSENVFEEICNCKLVDGVLQFLENHYKEYNFFLISATPTEELINILQRINIKHYFIDIFGSPKNKKYWLSYLIKNKSLDIKRSLFIGDAESDKIASNAFSIDFCLRLNGDNEDLIDNNVLFTIDNFDNMHKFIK